jgi:glycosyltransferase involved in cell wall biosynthesis
MTRASTALIADAGHPPTVTVALPVLDEERHLLAALASIAAQTYPAIVEVLVADGGSRDRTREIATAYPGLPVRVLDNPGRIQAAGLNVALGEAQGSVFVRVDGHCVLEPDYVARCVDTLLERGAALVGGGMTAEAEGSVPRGIALAMGSRYGAGPARFHRGGSAGWVDTVYLGAFPTELGRRVGGYAEDVGVNEDAEFAIRLGQLGGIWYEPTIRSHYTPRSDIVGLARQFYRYGRSRALTVRRHPESLQPRQLAAPALVLGLVSPWRKSVAAVYVAGVAARTVVETTRDRRASLGFAVSLPTMHLAWGTGFLVGLVRHEYDRRDA